MAPYRFVHRFGEDDDWSFSAKLGYQIDGEDGEEEPESEHLWFDVHAVDGARLDATLLNEPYGIARFSAGDRDWHAADQLSDWTVHAPEGTFGPDSIGRLMERLG